MKNVIIIFLLTMTSSLIGQSHSDVITQRFETYSKHLEAKQIDEMMEFVYPKIFDLFPKEEMTAGIKEMMFDDEMEVDITNSKLIKLSDTQYYDEVNYAILSYSNTTSMKFPNDDSMKEYINMMIDNFKLIHGEDNVAFDASSNKITINAKSKLIAVNNPEYGDWYFIEDNPQLYVYDFVPEGVINYMSTY